MTTSNADPTPFASLERHLTPEGRLEPKRRDDAKKARRHVWRQPVTRGRILAELPFGFWRYVVGQMDPALADWLRATSRLTEVLDERPDS